MKFRISIEEFKALPEEVQKLYQEKDGQYELQVDGMVSKAELSKFRDNNIALMKQMDELKEKFKDIDPEKYAKLLAEADKIADKKILDDEGLEALFSKRVEQLKKDYENQINTLAKDRDSHREEASKLTEQLAKELIDSKITQAVMDKSLGSFRSEHLLDALNRGRAMWKIVDGEPVPYDSNGGIRFGKDGKSQMNFLEWAEELSQTTPGFWESSQGSDATGGKKPSGDGKANKEYLASLNPAERMRAARQQAAEN